MKVFIVGDHGPEHNSIRSIHRTRKGALKEWNKLRVELLRDAISMLKRNKDDGRFFREMMKRIIKNLGCKDPDKIDNYPHETPYIHEWDVKE